MSRFARLTPLGSAREAFLRSAKRPPFEGRPAGPDFPASIAASVANFEGGHELLVLAWELTRCAEGLEPAEQRALMLLTLASLVGAHQGSTRIPISGSTAQRWLTPVLASLGATGAEIEQVDQFIRRAQDGEIGKAGAVLGRESENKPLLLGEEWLTHARLKHFETRVTEAFRSRLAQPSLGISADEARAALRAILERPPTMGGKEIKLSDEQQDAVLRVLRSRLTVISGGPGTGKTSIVVSLLRALLRLGVPLKELALAAPTGKAANRMGESIRKYLAGITQPDHSDELLRENCPEPQTLHRLLGYSPGSDRFHHHENNPLSAKVVIVDESSMIDLFMMDRLVRSTPPEARLILLGDADQLPSVEAGAVFRDLSQALVAEPRQRAAVRLTQSYRMNPSDPAGRNVYCVAREINKGQAGGLLEPGAEEGIAVRATPAELRFEKVELLEGAPEPFLERWFEDRVHGLGELDQLARKRYHFEAEGVRKDDLPSLQALFKHFESFRVLCLTREGAPTSAGAVNAFLHARTQQSWRGVEGAPRNVAGFLPGEPVLVQSNDYERGLFNGDQGLLIAGATPETSVPCLLAVFPRNGTFVAFPFDSLANELALAYAMTVHKSQGSEFDFVALMLPEEDLPLLTREILYTAISRSRRSVVIVGGRELLVGGAAKRIERFSGIAEGLRGGDTPVE